MDEHVRAVERSPEREAELDAQLLILWEQWWASLPSWERKTWLKRHRALREVLRQGGDPMRMAE